MGELARSPNAPQLPETPLELMTPRPGDGYLNIHKMSWPAMGALAGVGSSVLHNTLAKRPRWAGIQKHLVLLVLGAGLGIFLRDIKYASKSEDDAVIRHYISLHPDDFPPFQRKRWAEVYEPFRPYR